jgi:hypothetical protein
MSEQRDPQRWLEGQALSPELHQQFVAYGANAPSPARRERMFAELERQLADGTPPVVDTAVSVKLKLVLGLGTLVVGSLALLALWWFEPSASVLVPAEPTSAQVAIAPIVSRPPELAPAPDLAPTPLAVNTLPARPKPRSVLVTRERASAEIAFAPSTPMPVRHAEQSASAPPQAGPLGELTLLARARRALLVEPERALELAEEHAHHYPEGTFAEEREVLAIESLLKLQRTREAERRVGAFVQRFPRSSHREHLAQLVSADRAAMIDGDAER